MNQHDETLLQILSNEIAIDGGASLVKEIKEYNPRIEALLKNASKPKLLSFLELYPGIFEVKREELPHFVYLISTQYLSPLPELSVSSPCAIGKKKVLQERMVCILGKEATKDAKRNMTNIKMGVNNLWLLKQCKRSCHSYLRASGFYLKVYSHYRDVKVVGSDAWIELVLDEFMTVVETVCSVIGNRVVVLENDTTYKDEIVVQDIATQVTRAVMEDGATHISLSLLLHRNQKLCHLLGGRDLIKLKENYGELFQDIHIFTKDNEVFLENPTPREGRMLVDETGLFSVASSKCGNAFANIMAKHCLLSFGKDASEIVAIDLTASVGGLTLSFAKTFNRCIAIEIDAHRAALCQENMATHACHNVHVRCQDSVEVMPLLGHEFSEQVKVIIIDPPWGGKYYKREKDKQIMMGKWTMVQVIERIYQSMKPALIGMRMPVDFHCEVFLENLRNGKVAFQLLEKRKVGPQLFIVLLII